MKNIKKQSNTLKSYFWNRLAWRQSEVGCICSGQAELLDGLDDIDCICQFKPNNFTLHMSWCYMCVDYIMIDILYGVVLVLSISCIIHDSWLTYTNNYKYVLNGSCRSSVWSWAKFFHERHRPARTSQRSSGRSTAKPGYSMIWLHSNTVFLPWFASEFTSKTATAAASKGFQTHVCWKQKHNIAKRSTANNWQCINVHFNTMHHPSLSNAALLKATFPCGLDRLTRSYKHSKNM